MTTIFADTFYYVALVSPDDRAHEQAVRLSDEIADNVLTTEFVLIEVANALRQPKQRGAFQRLYEVMLVDDKLEIVDASRELFRAGITLFLNRPDKEWSLTDCISFSVMKQRRIKDALTADHHFEQAGFVALLKQ